LGLQKEGYLRGGLRVKRHAKEMYERLVAHFNSNSTDSLTVLDWINIWALAVAEENAAGGKMVTAPTMGSAGIIPAVMRYMKRYGKFATPKDIEKASITFLATASAICSLYRTNASISGAEVGCQGEIGVACSMAAAGLVAAMGGNNKQIENAAEIAMEHNLGLTCDPINGLVQVPCIERNAMGAIKAVNAARLAMQGTGSHIVSLDSIIKTMYETGLSLNSEYKETSLAGIAKNALSC
jgi:L-serine dehydratase